MTSSSRELELQSTHISWNQISSIYRKNYSIGSLIKKVIKKKELLNTLILQGQDMNFWKH